MVLCRTQEEAEAALAKIRVLMEERGLTRHPEKTRIVEATQPGGFDFLGYHFERGPRWPRKKSVMKLKDSLRDLTPRSSGQSEVCLVTRVNRVLRGWFEYFKHSHRTAFPQLDQWVRRRLRSILRKRSKRQGISRGCDHNRWPNDYFRERGLTFLTDAHRLVVQSCHR